MQKIIFGTTAVVATWRIIHDAREEPTPWYVCRHPHPEDDGIDDVRAAIDGSYYEELDAAMRAADAGDAIDRRADASAVNADVMEDLRGESIFIRSSALAEVDRDIRLKYYLND